MSEGKRRAGRPTKPGPKDEKATLGIRANSKLKDRLLKAASANHRSLSQEAELRLEQSFREEDLLPQLLAEAYGERLAALLTAIGRGMKKASDEAGFFSIFLQAKPLEWVDHPYSFEQARKAAERILELAAPKGKPIPPDLTVTGNHPSGDARAALVAELTDRGTKWANGLITTLQDREWVAEDARWAEPLHKQLGEKLLTRMVEKVEQDPSWRKPE